MGYTLTTSGSHSYKDDHRLVSRVLVRVRLEVVNRRFTEILAFRFWSDRSDSVDEYEPARRRSQVVSEAEAVSTGVRTFGPSSRTGTTASAGPTRPALELKRWIAYSPISVAMEEPQ